MRFGFASSLAAFALSLLASVPAHAQWEAGRSYVFEGITNENPENVAAGERQLWVHVYPQASSPEMIQMVYRANRGDPPYAPLAITEVVIHDSIDIFANNFAVVIPATPSDVSVDFAWIPDPTKPAWITFRSNPADPVYWGVAPEDEFPLWTMLRYYPGLNIAGITGLELLFAVLDGNPTTGGITVTLKVEGFADGGTEYFELVSPIDTPPPFPTPEPSTGGPAAALAALALLRSRRIGMAAR